MALIKGSEPSFMTAEGAAQRRGFAAEAELELRNALEALCRERFPEARIVHELVMGQRQVRADVVAIAPSHIAAFEVKGSYDDTTRLLHQVGMYQLCVPEVWMVVADRHASDAKLIRHLLPSVGLIVGTNMGDGHGYGRKPSVPLTLSIEAEPVPRQPVPVMMLEMLWRDELVSACRALRVSASPKATRPVMIKALLAAAGEQELLAATCAELRSRDAIWRADPPAVTEVAA